MDAANRRPVVLFDGVCNLCESSVLFIIRRDRDAHFRFAQLQSAAGQEIMARHAYSDKELASVLLVADGKLYRKSRAALRIAKQLDGAWPLFYYLFFWVPPFVADVVYDFIGKRRYKWFGMKAECWLPDDNLRDRFIDDTAVQD